ncbi:unnamed protein product [Hydatigera taeniaeformis]|uniref:Secreted protein n=1 Tax=Hydatigena taeniaeformis TaxID=6205 RepID=A0A0R3WXV0_HYDTA|nr:unnamed protein product [Hydatigera taeniaeformis]
MSLLISFTLRLLLLLLSLVLITQTACAHFLPSSPSTLSALTSSLSTEEVSLLDYRVGAQLATEQASCSPTHFNASLMPLTYAAATVASPLEGIGRGLTATKACTWVWRDLLS